MNSLSPTIENLLKQYADFFEHSHEGIFIIDKDGKILFVNHAGLSVTQYSHEDVIQHSFYDFISLKSVQQVKTIVAGLFQGQDIFEFDLFFHHKDTDEMNLSVQTNTFFLPQAMILSFRDITESRSMEKELLTTKEFLEKLIDNSVDAIAASDMDGNIVVFNKVAEKITGYKASRVIGIKKIQDFVPKKKILFFLSKLKSHEHGPFGKLVSLREEIITAGGELAPVSFNAYTIYENNEEVALVFLFQDLRELFKIEKKLRDAQIENEKNAIVAELAGAAAHELNQPLTSIIGYSELLHRRMNSDDPNHKTVATLLQEAERIAEIVQKLGKVTKYRTKTYIGDTKIVDLETETKKELP